MGTDSAPGVIAYLGLGSNLGDRQEWLRQAAWRLQDHPAIEVQARSRIYETQSVEDGGEGDFLNAAVRVQTTLTVRQLLQVTRGIEETLGRPAPPRQGSRTVDIDILLYGEEAIREPDLQVPHPRLLYRTFVLRPLCDVLQGGWLRIFSEKW